MKENKRLKIIIFGMGSIGQQHARVLQSHFNCELYCFRSGKGQSSHKLKIKEIYTWEEVEAINADVAFITNPSHLHVSTAIHCATLGMHLFIEKPLSSNLDGIDVLEQICKVKNLTCYVAYCLRFHPVINKMKELLEGKNIYHSNIRCSSFLPEWRKDQDHRKSYSSENAMGGGVILDLSHEFDYVQYLFGSINEIHGQFERRSNITNDAEDYTDCLVRMENSIPINLHLNFFSHFAERAMTVDFQDGFVNGDLIKNQVIYQFKGRTRKFNCAIARSINLKIQTEYFFDNLSNPLLMNNLSEAKKLLEKLLEYKCADFLSKELLA